MIKVVNDGAWKRIRLTDKESQLVSDKALENWYASHTENEYRVRVLGLCEQMESKKDMAVASPDILDCFAMLFTLPFMDSEVSRLIKESK